MFSINVADDYRLTAACSIVKWVVLRHSGELDIPMIDDEDDEVMVAKADGSAIDEESRVGIYSTTTSPSHPKTTPSKCYILLSQ